MLIINDVHIGFSRAGGTTPTSRESMRTYLFRKLRELIDPTTEDHLLIQGDLFDDFDISTRDLLETYTILNEWLIADARRSLTLAAGNHDHSPKALRVSSFEVLATILGEQFGQRVRVVPIDQWWEMGGNVVLAHCSNQDIFDRKLTEILDYVTPEHRALLLHANYDNNFAAVSDHSLNVTKAQAQAFAEKGITLYFAHEHQARTELGGSVMIFGNQWPTSVADCLNNDNKFAHVMTGDVLHRIETWHRDDDIGYAEITWDGLARGMDVGAKFIKVIGEATTAQAAEVINAIAKFRQKSDAFVITNGVKIDGIVQTEELPAAFEATKRFDVLEFVQKHLDAAEYAVVMKLLGHEVRAAEPAAAPAPVNEFEAMEA